jgi:hypothetical protein
VILLKKGQIAKENKIEDKFYKIVDKKNEEISDCNIEGNWSTSKKQGSIRVCSNYNKKRNVPTTHRKIKVKYNTDGKFIFLTG